MALTFAERIERNNEIQKTLAEAMRPMNELQKALQNAGKPVFPDLTVPTVFDTLAKSRQFQDALDSAFKIFGGVDLWKPL